MTTLPPQAATNETTIPRSRPTISVGCVGVNHMEGTEDALKCAVQFAGEQGYNVAVYRQEDVTVIPYHGVGAMRNNLLLIGYEAGASYLAILDNDVTLAEDSLVRLAERCRSAIVPYFDQSAFRSEEQNPILVSRPPHLPNQGMAKLEWSVSSCLMFTREAFRLIGPRPFSDPLIADEDDYNWRAWRFQGIELWEDTDTTVRLLKPPTVMTGMRRT